MDVLELPGGAAMRRTGLPELAAATAKSRAAGAVLTDPRVIGGTHCPARGFMPTASLIIAAMSTDPFTVGVTSVPIPNSYWVRPGQLLAGEYPGSTSLAEANQRIQMLLHAGVNSFVDQIQDPRHMCRRIG